jgi:hypothetical protein
VFLERSLVKRAMEALIPYATIYLCESGFSILVTIKTKKIKTIGCPT